MITFTLGAAPTDPLTSLPTYGAICAGGSKFTATVNNWKPTATATAFTDGKCVITLAGSADITGLSSSVTIGAISMSTSSLSFD